MKNAEKKRIIALVVGIVAVLAVIIFASISSAGSRGTQAREFYDEDSAGKSVYNFLIAGKDDASGLTDVIMVVSFDLRARSLNIVHIPRDTYAVYATSNYRKLNGACHALGGAEEFCDYLSESMGIPIDYYVMLDSEALGEAVDAIGGVEINIPFDFDYNDPVQGLSIHLPAGNHTLDGDQAEQFVRYRSGYLRGDIGRIDAQKIFLAALARSIRNNFSVWTVGKLVFSLADDIDSNIQLDEMYRFAKAALSVEDENIRFVTLAGDDARAEKSGAWYYVISKSAAREICEKYLCAYPDAEFDRDGIFRNSSYDSFANIYDSYSDYTVYDASSINEGELKVTHS